MDTVFITVLVSICFVLLVGMGWFLFRQYQRNMDQFGEIMAEEQFNYRLPKLPANASPGYDAVRPVSAERGSYSSSRSGRSPYRSPYGLLN